jgi:hypothetical protein
MERLAASSACGQTQDSTDTTFSASTTPSCLVATIVSGNEFSVSSRSLAVVLAGVISELCISDIDDGGVCGIDEEQDARQVSEDDGDG